MKGRVKTRVFPVLPFLCFCLFFSFCLCNKADHDVAHDCRYCVPGIPGRLF